MQSLGLAMLDGSLVNLLFQVSNGIGTMVVQRFTLPVAKMPLQVVANTQRRLFGQAYLAPVAWETSISNDSSIVQSDICMLKP